MTNQEVKPFTLEWWLNQLIASVSVMEFYNSRNHTDFKRYLELADWIRRRVIEKYGESKT